jgi:predicted component of type VI protein secretion system
MIPKEVKENIENMKNKLEMRRKFLKTLMPNSHSYEYYVSVIEKEEKILKEYIENNKDNQLSFIGR